MSQIVDITPGEMFGYLEYYASKGWNAYFHGASGIGKSEIVKAFSKMQAKSLGLVWYQVGVDDAPEDLTKAYAFIDYRVCDKDVLDMKGAPHKDDGKTVFLPASQLPDVRVHGAYGMFFLDEIAQGTQSVTNGLSQLVHDHTVGDRYSFPKDGWIIVAASNRKQDGAATNRIGAQIHNRFGHFNVKASVKDWCKYQLENGSDGRLPAFIRLREDLLHAYTKGDIVFSSPRVWTKADEVLREIEDKDFREKVISSLVGVGPARELEGFLAMYHQLATIKQIVKDPLTAKVPEQGEEGGIAATYALIGMTVARATEKIIDPIVTYISRYPKEFQQLWGLDILASKPDLQETVAFSQWRANIGEEYAV